MILSMKVLWEYVICNKLPVLSNAIIEDYLFYSYYKIYIWMTGNYKASLTPSQLFVLKLYWDNLPTSFKYYLIESLYTYSICLLLRQSQSQQPLSSHFFIILCFNRHPRRHFHFNWSSNRLKQCTICILQQFY